MKKISKIVIAVLLVTIMFSLSACGEDAVFKGNYKEATDEDLANLSTQLSETTVMEPEEGAESAGAELSANLSISAKQGTDSMSISLKAGSKLSVSKEGEASVSGNVELTAKNSGVFENDGTDTFSEVSAKGNVYMDSKNIYYDGSITKDKEDVINGKNKLSLSILEMIAGSMGDMIGSIIPDIEIGGEAPSVEQIKEFLAEHGITLYVDSSDGFKVKASVSEEYIKAVFSGMMGGTESGAELTVGVKNFDFYLVIDKEGRMAGVKADVSFTVKATVDGETVELNVDGDVSFKVADVTVTLPEDLKEYKDYNPITA
ncbi:MAG: hypothetical protein ACI4S9_03300 [Christensenellales bacterium]